MRASLHVSRTTRVLYADTLESGWWAGVPQEENVSLSSARARVPPWPAPRPRARARRRPRSEQALLPSRARGPRRRAHHGGRGLLRRRRALRERRRGADDRVPPGLPGERPRGRPQLPCGGPRGRRSRQRRPRRALVPPRLLRRLRARPRREQRRGGLPRAVASLGVLRRGRAGGKLTPGRGRQRHRRGAPAGPLGSLREPSSALPVLEDDDVATRLEQHLEVAPPYRLLRPPAVDHPPLLAEPLPQTAAAGADELPLRPRRLGQLAQLEPELCRGGRQLDEPGREREPEAVGLRRRLAQRERAAPGAAADELRREGELPRRPAGPPRAREQALEERRERAPERELVRDRLGKGERLRELGGRAAGGRPP